MTARLAWAGGEHAWRWQGDVPADSAVRVGMVRFVVPDMEGELALDLELQCGNVVATNRDTTTIHTG